MAIPPRVVRLVLVTSAGNAVGTLGPFRVDTPWWQDAEAVVRAARERHRVDVVLLRLLKAERPAPPGGLVTYLAEVERAVPSGERDHLGLVLDDHPLRMPWARSGGPDADLAWADRALAAHGIARTGQAEQVRTWNLSSLWRLPLPGGTAWLKVVPPFFAHEGALLEGLTADAIPGVRVPGLLARDAARILMPAVPGDDLYEADVAVLERMVVVLVTLQRAWMGRTDQLLALGLPDWRARPLSAAIEDVVERTAGELDRDDRTTLAAFVEGLDDRFARIAATGLPDTLVHGDFHPGNFRGDAGDAGDADQGDSLVLLDWGDSGVGHPLLDEPAFLTRIAPEAVDRVRERWHAAWRAAVPGSEPARAARLLAPIAAARQAVIYRGFLDRIEPSERPYHAGDPLDWLQRTAAIVASAG